MVNFKCFFSILLFIVLRIKVRFFGNFIFFLLGILDDEVLGCLDILWNDLCEIVLGVWEGVLEGVFGRGGNDWCFNDIVFVFFKSWFFVLVNVLDIVNFVGFEFKELNLRLVFSEGVE